MDDLEITLAEYATPMGRLRFCAERPNHMHPMHGGDAKAIFDWIAALRARCAAFVEENDNLRTRVTVLEAERDALKGERDALKLEAQTHAQEARAQRATVHDIYRLCTGGTGEAGDWNGAEPVRAVIAARDAALAGLAVMRRVKEEDDAETAAFQNDIHIYFREKHGIDVDGGGVESGDWRDLSLAEIEQGANALAERCEEARQWTDDDKPLPEDDAILATHPDTPEGFALDREAMRLVGAKRSKGALVDLVRWLLTDRDTSERALVSMAKDAARDHHALKMDRDAAAQSRDALRGLLKELHALVRGECPRLLNEDGDGDGRLDMAIDAALALGEENL